MVQDMPAGGGHSPPLRKETWPLKTKRPAPKSSASHSTGVTWCQSPLMKKTIPPRNGSMREKAGTGRLDLPDRLFYLYFPLRPLLWATRRKGGRSAPPAATAGADPRFGQSAKAVRAFVRAPVAAKAMALEATLFLLLARLLVAHAPVRRWRRWLATAEEPAPTGRPVAFSAGDPEGPVPAGEHPACAPPRRLPRRVARIVRRVAGHVPFPAVCLPQAMALQWMLRRRGVSSRLVFGTRRKAQDSGLDFHAWLTVGGECVIGAGEVETYAALPPFGGIGPRPG